MTSIKLSAVVSEDRRLVVDLPPEIPAGPVELTIRSLLPGPSPTPRPENPKREALRAQMLEAGLLSTVRFAAEGVEDLPEEERIRAGTMPPGARPSEELVAEDRDRC